MSNKANEALFHLVQNLKRKMHEQINHENLGIAPMHLRVLKIIARCAPCNNADIANALGRDKAQITRLLASLLEQGLITKADHPHDKRSQQLHCTAQGSAMLEKLMIIERSLQQKMQQGIDEQELSAFTLVLEKMTRNLQRK